MPRKTFIEEPTPALDYKEQDWRVPAREGPPSIAEASKGDGRTTGKGKEY
jgi:hypothetical protein